MVSIVTMNVNGNYSHENPIQFLTNSLESSLCDYFDAYFLVTGNIMLQMVIIIQK